MNTLIGINSFKVKVWYLSWKIDKHNKGTRCDQAKKEMLLDL